jgi:predicted ester cyclase
MGYPPTGKAVSWQSMIFSHIADSVIVHEWGSSNLMEVLENNKMQGQQ